MVRDKVVKTTGCTWPIRRLYKKNAHPTILDPSLEVTTNYANDSVPLCSPVEFRVIHKNFPKNVPKTFTWELTSLRMPNGMQDEETKATIQALFNELTEKSEFVLPKDIAPLIVGYTATIKVTGLAWFTGETAEHSLVVTFATTGNYALKFLNTQRSHRPIISKINRGFTMNLEVPACLLSTAG